MGSIYQLSIRCDSSNLINIEKILGKSMDGPDLNWAIILEEDSKYFTQALPYFSELISENLDELHGIGVKSEEITFWYMYEYEQQCNMEFSPEIMKRLGDLGITLCVSCWEA